MNRFIRDSQPPNRRVTLKWVKLVEEQQPPPTETPYPYGSGIFYIHNHSIILWLEFSFSEDAFPSHPNGYRQSGNVPVLRGQNFCRYCLCSPCVIDLPPDFLRGYCSPHPANDEKRYRLYRLFWGLLNSLGVWTDDEYLERKESRTSVYDKREIIPKCVINVSKSEAVCNVV